jgi:hypothetical protein
MTAVIPDAALAQHIAVLGKTGSGKTFAIKGVVEQLLADRRRVGIVDPTGAWWGLRSSRDGKGAGFPILVLGGDHGDLPLPALGGAAVARLLTEQGVNLVADTSQLTVGERTRWFIDFATALYRLNRAPLHLVLDEAHNFAPKGKIPDPDTGKMLHAANTLASGGRSRGIRLALITQRPQKLHNDTLTSADTLIAMRVLAPHDRLAVEDWIKGCGDLAAGKEVLNSLASLQRGEGWVWYPEGGYLKRVRFPMIRTFDSSATPTDGHAIAAPKGAAEIDLTEIRTALADAVKEAEANDPKLLRQKIAQLERQLQSQTTDQAAAGLRGARAAGYTEGRQEGFADGRIAGARDLGELIAGAVNRIRVGIEDIDRLAAEAVRADAKRLDDKFAGAPPKPADRFYREPPSANPKPAARAAVDTCTLPPGERAVLTALAQYPAGLEREQLSVLTGYKRSSRDAYIQRLRGRDLITQDGDKLYATSAGVAALGPDFEPLPTGAALREFWLKRLPEGERAVLTVLMNHYPDPVSREAIDTATDYKRSSRDAYIQRLSARQLVVTEGRARVRASDSLFD